MRRTSGRPKSGAAAFSPSENACAGGLALTRMLELVTCTTRSGYAEAPRRIRPGSVRRAAAAAAGPARTLRRFRRPNATSGSMQTGDRGRRPLDGESIRRLAGTTPSASGPATSVRAAQWAAQSVSWLGGSAGCRQSSSQHEEPPHLRRCRRLSHRRSSLHSRQGSRGCCCCRLHRHYGHLPRRHRQPRRHRVCSSALSTA